MTPNFRILTSVLLAALAAAASEPVEWTAKPGDGPKSFVRHHGSTLEFKCAFAGFGGAFAEASDVRLWYQTNGMGRAWWSVPATRSNEVLSASWPPSMDPGADRVSFFFGAPSNAYASAVVRLQHSPGFAPNVLTPPVSTLDFDAIEVQNPPYWTRAESDARYGGSPITATVVTNIAAGVVASDAFRRDGSDTLGGSLKLPIDGGIDWGGTYTLTVETGSLIVNGNDRVALSSEIPTSLPWTSITGRPALSTVATSGAYDDLSGRPNLAQYLTLSNAATTYATKAELTAAANVATNALVTVSAHAANSGNPHNVTANQVGAYPRQDSIVFFDGDGSGDVDRPRILVCDPSNAPFDMAGIFYGGQIFGILGEMRDVAETISFRLDWPWGWTGTIATSNMVESVVATIPSTYASTNAIVSVNCSVQAVVDPPNNTLPTFLVPAAVPGGVRDWIVHVVSSGQTDITVTGFPATVDGDKTANFFSPLAAADLTKACTHGTVTTFTFTEINSTATAVNFMVMRAELQRVNE